MRINEIIDLSIPYHGELCPKIWEGMNMKEEVRTQLMFVAEQFIDQLKIPEHMVKDVTVTGSLANYNWSKYSDVDLHIIVGDLDHDLYGDYFHAKQMAWNLTHDITCKGHDVELYVQDESEPHHSSGVYSLSNDEWVVTPTHDVPEIDKDAVKRKVRAIANEIDVISPSCNNKGKIEKIKNKIKKMRQAGLDATGEFSTENLVYKVLRNNGYIDKLYDNLNTSIDKCLSI